MPGRDRTGPDGAGPRSGRGAGRCGSRDSGQYTTPGQGWRARFGLRSGGGRGQGRRRFFANDIPGDAAHAQAPERSQSEAANLQDQFEWLKRELDTLQKRIQSLTAK